MCKKSKESIDNLFLHCEVARNLWSSLLNLFGVDWVMPRRVRELVRSVLKHTNTYQRVRVLKASYLQSKIRDIDKL
jgi:hypothetical protein